MATQTSGSNSRLIAVGAVVLLVGVILVLLILRGTVGDDDTGATAPADDAPAADGTEEVEAARRDAEAAELVADGEDDTARVRLPLEIPEGQEAVTVQASFARGAAALPTAGDRVVAYRVAEGTEDDAPLDADDAERVLGGIEILGVIGPRPAANEGTLTVVLALDAADVPALLPVARDGALWLTLLPDDGTGDAAGDA